MSASATATKITAMAAIITTLSGNLRGAAAEATGMIRVGAGRGLVSSSEAGSELVSGYLAPSSLANNSLFRATSSAVGRSAGVLASMLPSNADHPTGSDVGNTGSRASRAASDSIGVPGNSIRPVKHSSKTRPSE